MPCDRFSRGSGIVTGPRIICGLFDRPRQAMINRRSSSRRALSRGAASRSPSRRRPAAVIRPPAPPLAPDPPAHTSIWPAAAFLAVCALTLLFYLASPAPGTVRRGTFFCFFGRGLCVHVTTALLCPIRLACAVRVHRRPCKCR